MEIELERTFLIKYLPEELESYPSKEISDIYFPEKLAHPVSRLRKRGDKYEITKKEVINGNDSSEQSEKTIVLDEGEFETLSKIEGKRLRKNRFYYPFRNLTAEIDVFLDEMAGLALADFEFDSREEMEKFEMPDFCLAEVTQDDWAAGGMLAGKKYEDIKKQLSRYNYKKQIF